MKTHKIIEWENKIEKIDKKLEKINETRKELMEAKRNLKRYINIYKNREKMKSKQRKCIKKFAIQK